MRCTDLEGHLSHTGCAKFCSGKPSSTFSYRLHSISSVPVSTVLAHRTGNSTRKQANSRGHNRLRSNEQTRLTLGCFSSRGLLLTSGHWGRATRMLRIAWGTFGRAPSADPGPSPPAPPRARARPASYARRLSLPQQYRGGEGPRLVGEPRPQTRAGPYTNISGTKLPLDKSRLYFLVLGV